MTYTTNIACTLLRRHGSCNGRAPGAVGPGPHLLMSGRFVLVDLWIWGWWIPGLCICAIEVEGAGSMLHKVSDKVDGATSRLPACRDSLTVAGVGPRARCALGSTSRVSPVADWFPLPTASPTAENTSQPHALNVAKGCRNPRLAMLHTHLPLQRRPRHGNAVRVYGGPPSTTQVPTFRAFPVSAQSLSLAGSFISTPPFCATPKLARTPYDFARSIQLARLSLA